jgi:ATP-dependent exoDNAse (exonuclease V) beta subunit
LGVALKPERDLRFPEFVLLKASAGSGKTHALSLRFVQLLLAERPAGLAPADLRNILAITFTRNAAREMKARILDWLKKCNRGDPAKSAEVLAVVDADPASLPARAAAAVGAILTRYTDFQVETIDSFMAAVFKASAVDLGFAPDFEIVLDADDLVEYAFFRYLRRVSGRTREGGVFRTILEDILGNLSQDATFHWDPSEVILRKMAGLYGALSARGGELVVEDEREEGSRLRAAVASAAAACEARIEASGLEKAVRSQWWTKIGPAVREGRFADLVGASFRTLPVRGGRGKGEEAARTPVEESWRRLEAEVNAFLAHHARTFFHPYGVAFKDFSGTLDRVKRERGTVFIADINVRLAGYLEAGIVPDIYLRLGDRIVHFLIDEFQDTSPVQWANLRPLVENALAGNGSLFVVGDTKQAIYGFRNADYRIMRGLESGRESFPSAAVDVRELSESRRCRQAVLAFVKKVFLEGAPRVDAYASIAPLSGLTEFRQDVLDADRDGGYVEYVVLERNQPGAGGGVGEEEGDPAESEDASPDEGAEAPERTVVQDLVRDLRGRGYAWADIAVLTYKNDNVVRVASWLNEVGIPFIPFSSLDIRKRAVVREILSLLLFLDAPPDDLSFASFLLGRVFAARSAFDPGRWRSFLFESRAAGASPLYVAFRKRHPEVWDGLFERLFKSVGYYPLYDLVTLAFRVFNVFELFPKEEAALVKLLEVIRDFEGTGRNDLREFLAYAGRGEGEASAWTIDVPSEIDAVKVMSIHKAKGLGFPAVVLLLYGERYHPPEFFLEEEDGRIRAYRLNQRLARVDETLGRIYEEDRRRETVNRLNTLYVGLTRARSELHVIGVRGRSKGYPFDLLGTEGYASAPARPGAPSAVRREETSPAEMLRFPEAPAEAPRAAPEPASGRSVRRGELVHEILAGLEFLRVGWEADIAGIVATLPLAGPDRDLAVEAGRAVVRALSAFPRQDLFTAGAGRRALREFAICDREGRSFRIDRLVLEGDRAVVIDFKTGAADGLPGAAERRAGDREQVRAYLRLVEEAMPGARASGSLIYIDRADREDVE